MPALTIDLKFRLTLRVVMIAALCCLAAASYVLIASARSSYERVEWTAETVAKDLALQKDQLGWIRGAPDRFPELQTIAAALTAPALCIAYRAPNGDIVQQLCNGASADEVDAPQLFASLYERLFMIQREAVRPVMVRGGQEGEAVAWIDREVLIGQAWREMSRFLTVMVGALLVLCALTYAALARALRPTQTIRFGLERLAAGDLSARLPPFDLAELSAVALVFNDLAGRLEATLTERNALTRRLISVQDDERQHLARELHDEFGQCLAAISAMAASASQTAEQECPALLIECQSISRTTAQMMTALRGALVRLRPPDVEELGLSASLESLIAGWNSRLGGRTRFSIDLNGEFDALPLQFATSLYRVAQEAVTNAAKHAQATQVTLRFRMQRAPSMDQAARVEISVTDDGKWGTGPTSKPGMGLLGMRERIAVLGGRLSFETLQPNGLILHAQIPVPQNVALQREPRKAA